MKSILPLIVVLTSATFAVAQNNIDKPIGLDFQPSSTINAPVGDAVKHDSKAFTGQVMAADSNRLQVAVETPISVKDGSGRTVKRGDVAFLLLPNGTPPFPTGTRISTKINPVGSLQTYTAVTGANITCYAFHVTGKIRELK